jgi:hypothetical protein
MEGKIKIIIIIIIISLPRLSISGAPRGPEVRKARARNKDDAETARK